MTIIANTGPQIVFGLTQSSTGRVMEYNEERAPSLVDLGDALLDPRPAYTYFPGQRVGQKTYGFWQMMGVVDQVPTTISTNCIAQVQQPISGTALTLTTSSTGAITLGATGLIAPETGATVANASSVLVIDGLQTGLTFGSAGGITMWDPTKASARCVTITVTASSSLPNDGGMTWTIAGRDLYGFKVSEQIAGSTQTSSVPVTYTSQKAYKYITAVTPINSTGTLKSTSVIVGVSDTYGFPLRVDQAPYVFISVGKSSNATVITAAGANHTFASTATATSTTPDVRGTYASSVASNSTAAAPVRIMMFATPSVQNMSTITASDTSGLFGVTQFSSV